MTQRPPSEQLIVDHSRSASAPQVTVNDIENDGRPSIVSQPVNPKQDFRSRLDTYPNVRSRNLRGHKWGGDDFKGDWRRNAHNPGVPWHEKVDCNNWKDGRVLLIDYVGKERTESGRRKIVAQEFWHVGALKKFYAKSDRCKEAALRVVHVQNASWATRFLLQKFNINHHNDLVGTDFGRWAKYERPQRRAGKPVLNGKTFKAQRDPWRGLNRTAFGVDYLKEYERNDQGGGTQTLGDNQAAVKMMELNCYDENDTPTYGYDVFVQRLSIYIQRNEGPPEDPDDPSILNPYGKTGKDHYELQKENPADPTNGNIKDLKPFLQSLDNGNTIIIFEHSQTELPQDTLIPARGEIENRWRRLAFYLPREDTMDDRRLAIECMDIVLSDVFKSLAAAWDRYLYICSTHVGILEDKIYESPADESRAPELWTNSSLWLKVEKLITIHSDTVKEMQQQLEDLDDSVLEHGAWIRSMPAEFDKIANNVQEDLVKPTANLNDLMYKSVGIRDSRHSLQLGTSMWRLSWITFSTPPT